jgi:nucleotide-binding universal stress UspA family protein
MKVIAILSDKHASEAAVASASEFARTNDAELIVVGVIAPRLDAPQPAFGERVRRYRQMELALSRAVAHARQDGLVAKGVIRYGEARREALAEAAAREGEHVFLPSGRGWRFGRGSLQVEHVVLPGSETRVDERELLAA